MGRVLFVLAGVLLFAACLPQQPESDEECRNDNDCPSFSREATKVACDCTCDVKTTLTSSRSFKGVIDTCLPPRLNHTLASTEERVALEVMTDGTFNRNVYDVCRDGVAHFIQAITRSQVGKETSPLCMFRPVECRCAPKNAWADPLCNKPCPEIECTRSSCDPLLREGGMLYPDACVCTRVRACGASVPADNEPALCRVSP